MLNYTQLLDRAAIETRQLKAHLEEMNRDYFEMSVLGNRLDVRNLDDFNNRKKALFAEILLADAELIRRERREAYAREKAAQGEAREVFELTGSGLN